MMKTRTHDSLQIAVKQTEMARVRKKGKKQTESRWAVQCCN